MRSARSWRRLSLRNGFPSVKYLLLSVAVPGGWAGCEDEAEAEAEAEPNTPTRFNGSCHCGTVANHKLLMPQIRMIQADSSKFDEYATDFKQL